MLGWLSLMFVCAVAVGQEPPTFLRGMGWSPWHAVHGWGRPPEVVEQDFGILADLHVNALRTWGPMSRPAADGYWAHGLYLLPQIGRDKLPAMAFADGKESQPAYVLPEALASIRAQGEKLATELRGHPAVVGYLLGNEYSWVGQNGAGLYQYLGFDAPSLAALRDHLRQRFGTVERWCELTGRDDASFDAFTPRANVVKDLAFCEAWRWRREVFEQFLRAGHEGVHEADPEGRTTYAKLCGGRWDPATEDAHLPFLDIQGDNLYYHWDKTWLAYCVRLARCIGPGRPLYLTETGFNTLTYSDPAEASRLMTQMLWLSAMHAEVRGIFPFVYCDEWWHGPDPKAQDDPGDYWGIVTADRQPKSTYPAVKSAYGEFERLDSLMRTRRSEPAVLVTDQCLDGWRGGAGPPVSEACRELYRHGVSFQLVSLLEPEVLQSTDCRRLLLLDSTIPDEPDGTSPARAALVEFVRRGGQIRYLNDQPWRGLYLPTGPPPGLEVDRRPTPAELWPALVGFVAAPDITIDAGEAEVFWRVVEGDGGRWLWLVVTGPSAVPEVRMTGASGAELASADGVTLERDGEALRLRDLNVYALLRL